MDIQFIATVAVISPDPEKSRELFIDVLGLPLEASPGSDYFNSEQIEGSKHFAVWPLSQAAEACFGTPEWPADRAVPQVSIEFEVRDADAVQFAAEELRQRGFTLLHDRARGTVGPNGGSASIARRLDHRDLVRALAARLARLAAVGHPRNARPKL